MSSNNVLRNSVRLAMAGGLTAALTAPAAIAQDGNDEEARELERVQVTGTRISRTMIEGATPVVTIDRDDIDATGFQSVADVLRNTTFNTAGSFREQSGTTAQGTAMVSMRGLGANRTLVLLNGRRMPGSPVLDGDVNDLNTLPFAAVERIEILSDGASAIYGSDAIGGVINIILRSDFEGAEANVRLTDTQEGGAEKEQYSLVGGVSGPRGHMTYALEYDYTDIIFSRDRDYLAFTDLNDPQPDLNTPGETGWDTPTGLPDFFDTDGVSIASRNVLSMQDFSLSSFLAEGDDCSVYGDGHYAQQYDRLGDPVCVYDFTQSAAETADVERTTLFFDSSYEINPDLNLFARGTHNRNESFGRYAPAAAGFPWGGPPLTEEEITAENVDGEETTVTLQEVNPGDQIWYRFDMTGPSRDTHQFNYMTDVNVGLEGFHFDAEWEAGYHHNRVNMHEFGTGYVNQMGLDAAAEAGWDPRHPDQEQFGGLVDDMRENTSRHSEAIYDRVDFGAQLDGPELTAAGPMQFFVGTEYFEQSYYDVTSAQAEAGNVLGTAGGSAGGERDVWAVFGEASLPVTDTVEFDFALRHDDYSDFGTNLSGKISGRWQPTDAFILRGSYGEGFRAPTLNQLFQAPAQSFAFATDFITCMGGTFSELEDEPGFADDLRACVDQPTQQHETLFASNEDLDAETSEQINLGLVYDFQPDFGVDFSASLDYYWIRIDNVITGMGTQDVMWLAFLEQLEDFEGLEYNDPDAGVPHRAQPTNFEDIETEGMDLNLRYATEMGDFGTFGAELQWSHVIDFLSRDIIVGPKVNQAGRGGFPRNRANLSLRYGYGPHTVTTETIWISDRWRTTDLNPEFDGDDPDTYFFVRDRTAEHPRIPSWQQHNVRYSYEAPWDARITLGINNINNEDPHVNRVTRGVDNSLYSLDGREYVVEYTQRF